MTSRTDVDVGGRTVSLSDLDKVLWPALGLTKAWLIDIYQRLAPVLLPHVRRHPLTLLRMPDGLGGAQWYETRAPAHPPWIETATSNMRRTGKVFDVAVVDNLPGLAWAAQIAAVEFHPFLGRVEALGSPTCVVFDLDPGPPATLADACGVALRLSELLDRFGLRAWPKTSGGVGLHVYVPLNGSVTYEETKRFAHAVALLLERERPGAVTSVMAKARRAGKVFVDWSQNDFGKSTIARTRSAPARFRWWPPRCRGMRWRRAGWGRLRPTTCWRGSIAMATCSRRSSRRVNR